MVNISSIKSLLHQLIPDRSVIDLSDRAIAIAIAHIRQGYCDSYRMRVLLRDLPTKNTVYSTQGAGNQQILEQEMGIRTHLKLKCEETGEEMEVRQIMTQQAFLYAKLSSGMCRVAA